MKATVIILLISLNCFGQTYYVSPSGNANNNGLSPAQAWTVEKANKTTFNSDTIILIGTITSVLRLDAQDISSTTKPIVIRSNGARATIGGIEVNDIGGVEIRNINVNTETATHNGIKVYVDKKYSTRLQHIVIDSVEVYGATEAVGILVGAWNTQSGYENVTISNSTARDNGKCGIQVFGDADQFSHRNVTIKNCKAFRNLGVASITTQNTGSGIVISNAEDALIENCEAYENGANNRNNGGGPVGIWFYNTKNGVIRNCESHHNKAGLNKDGGGFDIDGGSQNCVIENSYSHDNEGPGFLMAEYGSTNAYTGNIIRNNRSERDGTKIKDGALVFWSVDAIHPITNSIVENNVFIVTCPTAVNFYAGGPIGVTLRNNIFYVKSTTKQIVGNTSKSTLTNNQFIIEGALPIKANSYTLKRVGNMYEGSFIASQTTDTKEFWIMVSSDGKEYEKVKIIIPQKIEQEQLIKFSFSYEK